MRLPNPHYIGDALYIRHDGNSLQAISEYR